MDCYKKREWLELMYVQQKLDANAIGRIVGRNGKTIWTWLKKLGIPTRPRGSCSVNWMRKGQRSLFKGKRHTDETRKLFSQQAKADGRVPFDPKIGPSLKGKRGTDVPTWKGGVTPERQAFYSTQEWKKVAKEVWRRDNATCQKCGRRNKGNERFAFDIHHITDFSCVELRAEASNLVLLCEVCHYWVHSGQNICKMFIKGG